MVQNFVFQDFGSEVAHKILRQCLNNILYHILGIPFSYSYLQYFGENIFFPSPLSPSLFLSYLCIYLFIGGKNIFFQVSFITFNTHNNSIQQESFKKEVWRVKAIIVPLPRYIFCKKHNDKLKRSINEIKGLKYCIYIIC